MIILLQSLDFVLNSLRLYLGNREGVFFTGSHREALAYVRDNEPIIGRTVAIVSNNYQGELVDGSIISLGIKDMRPRAWCLVYSTERPSMAGVDGWINKNDPNLPSDAICQLVDVGVDDPERIPDLEALYARFPWIQRPVR